MRNEAERDCSRRVCSVPMRTHARVRGGRWGSHAGGGSWEEAVVSLYGEAHLTVREWRDVQLLEGLLPRLPMFACRKN